MTLLSTRATSFLRQLERGLHLDIGEVRRWLEVEAQRTPSSGGLTGRMAQSLRGAAPKAPNSVAACRTGACGKGLVGTRWLPSVASLHYSFTP